MVCRQRERGRQFCLWLCALSKDDNFKSFYSIIAEFAKDYAITGVSPPSLSVFSVPLKFDDNCVEKVIKDITLSDLIQAYAELTLSFAVIDADGKCVLKGCILNLPLKQSIRTKIYPLKITNLSLSVCTVLNLLIKKRFCMATVTIFLGMFPITF